MSIWQQFANASVWQQFALIVGTWLAAYVVLWLVPFTIARAVSSGIWQGRKDQGVSKLHRYEESHEKIEK